MKFILRTILASALSFAVKRYLEDSANKRIEN